MNPNQSLIAWFCALPQDVFERIVGNIFTDIAEPENFLLDWQAGAEVPIVAKASIQRAAEMEGYPFSFGDPRVDVMGKVIQLVIDMAEEINPDISADDLMRVTAPVVEYAAAQIMELPVTSPVDADQSSIESQKLKML